MWEIHTFVYAGKEKGIHDELLIETHPEEIEQVKKILQEEMVHACDLAVPLIADVKQGNSWYEAK